MTPPGAAIVAVLASDPDAVPDSVALSTKVALPPDSRLTVALMLPEPVAGQVEPADAVQVQDAPVSAAGTTSVTVAPIAAPGPALVATIV